MRRSQRSTSTFSTLQLALSGLGLLAIVIVGALLWAPRKPTAPPTSAIAYQPRPESRVEPPATPAPPAPEAAPAPVVPLPAPATPPQPAPAASGLRLQGTVQDAHSHEPLPGIRLQLTREARVDELQDLSAREAAAKAAQDEDAIKAVDEARQAMTATTEAFSLEEGHYEIAVPAPGNYHVATTTSGYVPFTSDTVTLDAQNPASTIDILLSTGARVRGRVTETTGSKPAPDIVIRLEQNGDQKTLTDAQGNYELGGLLPGEYGILAELSRTPYRTGKTLPYQKIKITDPNQTLENINFTVDPAGLVWGYVTTPDRSPVKGSEVVLCTSDSVFSQAISAAINQAPPIRDRSEEDGYYELTGVPLNEEWRLYATSNKSAPQLADPFLLTAQKREVRIDVFLFPGTLVQGRVVDPSGRPIADAMVNCVPSFTKLLSPLDTPQAFRNARSDADGYFEIPELPAGTYQIFGRKKGYKFSTVGDPIYPDGYSPISGFQVTLYPVEAGKNSVFGTVRTAAQQPISGAQVTLRGVGAESFDDVSQSTTSSGNGEFRIDDLEAGSYTATITAEGYAPRRMGMRLNGPNDAVLIAAGVVRGRVLIRETNAPPAQYEVAALRQDSEGRTTFSLTDIGEASGKTFNDPEGRFELYLPEGAYQLEARAGGLTPGREDVVITSGEVTDNVTLFVAEAGGTISGRVVTSDGGSPQGAEVFALDYTSLAEAIALIAAGGLAENRKQIVGQDGAFTFENLPEGQYLIVARHTGYANGQSELIQLAAQGNEDGVEVRLGAGGAIEGYVRRRGQLVANALIVVVGEGGTKSTSTNNEGFYRVENLATGTYQVTMTPVGAGDLSAINEIQSASVEVSEGTTTQHNFGDGTGATIDGVCDPPPPGGLIALPGFALLRPPGFPVAALGDILEGPESVLRLQGQLAAVSPGSGQFTIEDVFPGEYQLDIFYPVPGQLGSYRYVHAETVVVADESEIPLTVAVSGAF